MNFLLDYRYLQVIYLIVSLQIVGVPILPLVTGISIGGLAVALAAKETIKDFLGTIIIFVLKTVLLSIVPKRLKFFVMVVGRTL